MNNKLTIDQWHDKSVKGHFIPLHIPIYGVSMFPLIRYEKDLVTIVPLKETPVVGDIVLFHDAMNRYVLHRVVYICDGVITTRGDNCLGPDAPLTLDDIWGKAVLIQRGKRQIKPNPKRGMRHARCWYRASKIYRFLMRVLRFIYKRIKPNRNRP